MAHVATLKCFRDPRKAWMWTEPPKKHRRMVKVP